MGAASLVPLDADLHHVRSGLRGSARGDIVLYLHSVPRASQTTTTVANRKDNMRANRSRRSVRWSLVAAAVIAVMAFAGPASALAQQVSPTGAEYDTPVLSLETGGDPTTQTQADSASTLPFTGLDLTAFVAIGIGLLATGFVIRRVTKPQQLP